MTTAVQRVFAVTSAPEGAWPSATQAFYDSASGCTLFGYADNTGQIKIGQFNHTTRAVTSFMVGGITLVDQHNSPAILRRNSDGKIVASYCDHNSPNIYARISSAADDITAWGSEANIDASLGGTAYTYPALFQLLDETNDPIYLFFRDIAAGASRWCTSKSTDDGATWAAETVLLTGTRYYGRCAKSSETRLDFAITDGSYAEDYASLYHFYYDGGYFKSDGTALGAPPFTPAQLTKVYDGATQGARFPAGILKEGSAIAIVFPVQTGTPTDHVGENEDYKYARWNGSSWTVRTPVTSVGASQFNFTEGGLSIDPSDINHIAVSRQINDSWRIFDYTTADSGATWTSYQLSFAGDNDIYPWFVNSHAPELALIWLRGTFTDDDTFSSEVWGAGVSLPGVWVDWDGDGFANASSGSEAGLLARMMPEGGGTVSDEVTTDVRSIDITQGGTAEVTGGSGTDTATLVMENSTGNYSPDNASGVLYNKLKPGREVWIGVNADGTLSGSGQRVYPIFAGVIREVAPIPSGAAIAAETQIICDGILADYALTPVKLADSVSRSQYSFRSAVLDAIGEAADRRDLDDEADTLPLSSADSTSALSVLDELNKATGTRHFIAAGGNFDWRYTSRNRNYKFGAAADASIDASTDHLDAADWRYNNDSIINIQRATIEPVRFPIATSEVWRHATLPFTVSGNVVIWANFDDYVDSPTLDIETGSGSVTSSVSPFGHSAKIELYSANAQVTLLRILGRKVVRDSGLTVSAEDLTSQDTFRVRAGSDLSGDLLGSQASAQGIVDHVVYRYGSRPLKRPSISFANWLPQMFSLDLYDQVSVTLAAVSSSAQKFEIVGRTLHCDVAASASVVLWTGTFQLAESTIQGTQTWFTLDSSLLNGSDLLAY